MARIVIIIVNWNTGELLARCLQSLVDLPQGERDLIDEVVVVDNASRDKSVAQAKVVVGKSINQPRVRFVQQENNVGFAAGNNVALKRLLATGEVPHVLLLNPDTEVRAGALPGMLRVFVEQENVGIVGPRLLNPDNTTQGSVRPFPQFGDFVMYMLKLGRVVQSRQEGSYDYTKPQVVDQVMGAAFLIRDKAAAKVGELDEGFFTLFEEVDYCKRAQEVGWLTYFTPGAEVMHVKAASFSQLIGLRKTLPWLMSSLHYAKKYLTSWQVVVLWALVPVTLLLTIPAGGWHLVLKGRNKVRR